MNFQELVTRLKKIGVTKGVWIDAGCGNGTYSFPLASLSSQVVALDKNKNNLSYLESRITSETNIITKQFDFINPDWFEQLVDGVLFGFSLHYDPTHRKILENAYQQLKKGGRIIIIDYSSPVSVSWVPFPLPSEKATSILKSLSFSDIAVVEKTPPRRKSIHWDNAS
jgi:ubiquinone/menaquinone biosynthesis C-methylase UbiE